VAPDRFVARSDAEGLVQEAPLEFALAAGQEVASLYLRRDGGRWIAEARTVDARPASGVELRFGSGAAAVTDARGEARVPGGGEASGSWPRTAHGQQGGRIKAAAPPFEIHETMRVPLRPPSEWTSWPGWIARRSGGV
jgi:hypothetical protein